MKKFESFDIIVNWNCEIKKWLNIKIVWSYEKEEDFLYNKSIDTETADTNVSAAKISYWFSSGIKFRVMESMEVVSWVYLTPAASSIRLDARVLGVVAYLSDR